MKRIVIVGGGLAGLVAANLLTKCAEVILIEKKQYPFHRVCGEYISNETIPFLQQHNLLPDFEQLPRITKLWLTSVNGRKAELDLDLGGFGISRYSLDYFLFQKAVNNGATVVQDCEATSISFEGNHFVVNTTAKIFDADVVIGSFGKRSRLDKTMKRSFIEKKSPYVGVKYHIRTQHPSDVIALHNFKDGYCGISNIEEGKSTLCYLTHRKNLKEHKQIELMEREVLYRNPFLKHLFLNSEFLYDKPETINEISFETKSPVEDHVLMCGDAAGMITPLCGNGMALAIHSAKVASAVVADFLSGKISRPDMEKQYARQWNQLFSQRLWAGRQIQNLFGSEWASDMAVNLARYATPVASWLVKQTHGNPF
ncbi:MAG: NAD(P)/FAD-dependent oxidoreductase [Flammeovirgaceae bacterium]|jgi:flavin-dependent dehydrogenase|nr:NAD(P)/FAD-dependent oxidoreductase [Flammeovirgaceae bacterium]